ncbi:hypothetical protein B4U79_07858 [Dinothrombium tinctorium]|uniref:Uncharacterized protein n=1 Tax=Dinothrombium tinctorium TaxID=1965070 RepID=A0A3S3PL67_9ACAR|nr:hypothetical protein B4U79_14091 [Dinothrombium tinctorium]RWS11971.1 hypothetical protein B4U79_07858 [Dinothrombium tinctorium]
MGCAISKSHHRIIDSSSFKQNTSSSGSGSNKGEFIYDLISDQIKNNSCKDERNSRNDEQEKSSKDVEESGEKQDAGDDDDRKDSDVNRVEEKNDLIVGNEANDIRQRQNSETTKMSTAISPSKLEKKTTTTTTSSNSDKTSSYEYVYIDVEKLIVTNIKERVDRLIDRTVSTVSTVNNTSDGQQNESEKHKSIIKHREECGETSDCGDTSNFNYKYSQSLKNYLSEYGNVVTNNWLVGLLEKEINGQWHKEPEVIFLISLIPNRINLFRNCLYLKQTPNLSHLKINYIAINLIKCDRRKKDLDLVTNVATVDECVQNFLNYFRNANKLVEIKIENVCSKQNIKLSRSKQAIAVKNSDELFRALKASRKSENIELNLSEFTETDFTSANDQQQQQQQRQPQSQPCESLLFLVNNQIDLGEEIILIDDKELTSTAIRTFVRCYRKVKNSLNE